MPRIIAIANRKGGVGKTTTTVNVATAMAAAGKKVLVVDLDPQGNATTSMGINKSGRMASSYEVLLGEKRISEAVVWTEIPNFSLVPSSPDLAGAEVELVEIENREFALKKALFKDAVNYDYILIDCPPQLSILTINALSCADGVVIPVKTDYLAYRGLTQLQDSIQEIQELINPELKVLGVIATLYDTRVGDDHDILVLLRKEYNLLGVIKRLSVAKKRVYDGLAAVEQAPSSERAQEYVAIANMIMSGREKREEQEHE